MQRPVSRAFTMIELLLVLFVMTVLTVMAAPRMVRSMRANKLEQAAQTIMHLLAQARSEAAYQRKPVALVYGEDLSKFPTQPPAGLIPKPGTMMMYTMKTWASGPSTPYVPGYYGAGPTWVYYTYAIPEKQIIETPIVLPEGIRVVTGYYYEASATIRAFCFPYWASTKTSPPWLMPQWLPYTVAKRNLTAYTKTGSCGSGGSWSFPHILIFDNDTGEHVIIEAGGASSFKRPRIIHDIALTHIGDFKITQRRDLVRFIDTFPDAGQCPVGVSPNKPN
jgi:type II secretory pathway pseudopilin PulG